jgi:hypothetical protein
LKFVNPIKVARSRPANQFCFEQLLISQADPQMGAAHTSVLGKTDSAVRKELARFNLICGCLNQLLWNLSGVRLPLVTDVEIQERLYYVRGITITRCSADIAG